MVTLCFYAISKWILKIQKALKEIMIFSQKPLHYHVIFYIIIVVSVEGLLKPKQSQTLETRERQR